jgi:hypothetical protein
MARAVGHVRNGSMVTAVYENATHYVLIPTCELHGIVHEPVVVRKFDPESAPLIKRCSVCVDVERHAAMVAPAA